MSFEALASLKGAQAQASASKKAAVIYAQTAREQIAAEKAMFDKTEANLTPWREAGTNALKVLSEKTMAGPGEFTESPGYEFRVAEGQKGIENSAAARGNALSGATLKATERFRQDYATNEYDNFLSRYYQSLTPYQALSATGQNAAAQIGSFGAASTGAQSEIAMGNALYQGSALQNQGAYKAQGMAGIANAYSAKSAINTVLSAYSAWKGGGSRAN